MTAAARAPRSAPVTPITAPLPSPERLDWLAEQNAHLDVIGCHGSSGRHWREFERLDRVSDAEFTEALRLARAAGQHLIADHIERGLHFDHQERRPLGRIAHLFADAASACKRAVARIERRLTRRGR